MAKNDLNAYANIIPENTAMEMPEYLEAVRVAGLVPRRWLDARHAEVIVVKRNEYGTIIVTRASEAQEGIPF